MKRCLTALGCWLLLLPTLVLAGTTGSLKGLVSNAGDGSPVVGANVVLLGTTMGAASDINGVFYVTNIPAGTYSIRVTAVGYRSQTLTNLRISADLLIQQDFKLAETAIQGEEVNIIAERPLIELDKTASVQITDATELQQVPVSGYTDIIKIQSGVQTYTYNNTNAGVYYNENSNGPRISVRGSREDEVMFNVDGVTLNDPYSGLITFRVPDLAWNEFAFLKGNFSAEYGRFMSGVVNWTTKTGGDQFHVEAQATTDAINPQKSRFDQNKYGLAISGPILPGNSKYHFFTAFEHGDEGDRSPSYFDNGPKDKSGTTWNSVTAKLTAQLTDKLRLDVGSMFSGEEWNEYRHSYYYNTAHMPYYEDQNGSYFLRLNHALNSETNYTLNYYYVDIRRFRGDDTFRRSLWDYGASTYPKNDDGDLFFLPGRMFLNVMKRETSYYGLRGDLQKLVGFTHDIKAGMEYQSYKLRYYEHGWANEILSSSSTPFINLNNFGYTELGGSTDSGGDINGPREPVVMAFYAQDKIRLDYGIRVDLGLRWDYLDPAAQRIKNPARPLGEDGVLDLGVDTEEADAFNIWSPRLGVSFPVSDITTFHFNYGRYTQFPSFYTYYVDLSYFEHVASGGAGYFTMVGNPSLAPSRTTSYEFGVDHGLGDYAAVAFTAYYKSIKDYVNSRSQSANPASYGTYFNMDRAVTKGMETEFRLKPYKRFSAALNYTISWANGTGSTNDGNYRVTWTQGAEPPKFTNPLVYDRRHHFSGIVMYEFDRGDGPELLGVKPLENTTFGFNLDAASGRPYTKNQVWNEITLGNVSPLNERAINSSYIDWSYQLDFRLTRTFSLGSADLDLYFDVINLLNTENSVSVWQSSGDASTTYWLETNEGQDWLRRMQEMGYAGEEQYRLREKDPNNWSVPRMLQLGFAVRY